MSAPLKNISAFYQKRFGYDHFTPDPVKISFQTRVLIIIPCYDEEPEETMKSLGQCTNAKQIAEVLLIFNHPEGSDLHEKHSKQADFWDGRVLENDIEVHVIRAFELNPKQAGVGLARKIGMDTALQSFAEIDHDGLMVCLDADCEVSPNYMESLLEAESSDVNGLSIHFEHPLDHLPEQELKYITHYENWLRYYIQALRYTGYSHAFHTIGSSMAVRASVYSRVGGMNRRKAGEDFYFLHKLIPQGKFYDWTDCTVFPSSRISSRVPFGTGRAMSEMGDGRKDFSKVYHSEIFLDLKAWLKLGENLFEVNSTDWPESITKAFYELGWNAQFSSLIARSSNKTTLERNFRFWFDGFKMLKLVHYLRDQFYGDQHAPEAAKTLFNIDLNDSSQLLEYHRKMDQNSSNSYLYNNADQST